MALSIAAVGVATAAGVETWTTEDGTDVALVSDSRVPLVQVRIEFPVGWGSTWARENGAQEAFAIQIHDSARSLRSRADALAADVSLNVGERYATIKASCLSKDLPQVIRLVRDVMRNTDFDEDTLDRWSKNRALTWDSQKRQPDFRRSQAAARLMYDPADARRWPYEAPKELVTDTAALVATRNAIVTLPGRVVAFSGDVSRPQAEKLLKGLLPRAVEKRPAGMRVARRPLAPQSEREKTVVVPLPRLTQVRLVSRVADRMMSNCTTNL